MTRRRVVGWLALALGWAWALPAAAQPPRINIYRYVLDVDVPESAAFIALDVATSRVVRGSQPKPVAASLLHHSMPEGGWMAGIALDASPYYLLDGGRRTLASYRRMSVTGRLVRVLTKTTVSVGAMVPPGAEVGLRPAVAIRSTFHDPHDPISAGRIVEQVDSALAAAGLPRLHADDEEATGRGVTLTPVFAAARREMRARGDVQVSGGWGMAGEWPGAALGEGDRTQHTFWVTGQHARGPRLDLLVTLQLRDAFDDDRRMRAGFGVQRKAAQADLRLEAHYDWADRRIHPGVAVEVHAAPGIGVVGALLSDPAPPGSDAPARARLATVIRWYHASGR